MMGQYDEKYHNYLQLQEFHAVLKEQQTLIQANVSKDKVIAALRVKS
jgi:hypothetical protein